MDWKHASRARAAWKRYYHYWRLERHGDGPPWHGKSGWRRAVLTGLVMAVVIAFGLFHRWTSYEREQDAPQIIRPLTVR
jgi:hypothetical protein